MSVSTDQIEFALQVFDGKEYRTTATGSRRELLSAFVSMRHAIRRLVVRENAWPAKPKYYKPRGMMGSGRTRREMIDQYFAWAEKAGIKRVHVYADDGYLASAGGIECIPVPVADFLGPAPAAEPDECST